MDCLLSIIIPCYNIDKYIEDCLLSVLSQQVTLPYEVIAVDDGSTDNTGKILYSYAEKYSNLKIISQQNQGVSVARNAGLDVCRGEYVWFIDGDDYIKPNVLG